jgi:hypothetical protein
MVSRVPAGKGKGLGVGVDVGGGEGVVGLLPHAEAAIKKTARAA